MRIKHALVLSSLALVAMMLFTPLVQAIEPAPPPPEQGAVYSGYDRESIYVLWVRVESWELWVKIDTGADTWTITWKQTGSWPYTSTMYCWYESYVKAWDDKGFSWSWGPDVYPAHGPSGKVTLTYKNTYTWTHTEVCWCYMTTAIPLVTFDYIKCRVDIYVGS